MRVRSQLSALECVRECVVLRCVQANGANHNLQRPETVESLMYLWRVTKNPKWREAGWAIMQAFDSCCKVATGGYAGLRDVTAENPHEVWDDTQQSFWLAETLKYHLRLHDTTGIASRQFWVPVSPLMPCSVNLRRFLTCVMLRQVMASGTD